MLSHVFVISLSPFRRMDARHLWAGQIQRNGGPHNSLRARLGAAHVFTYIKKWKMNQIERRYL